MTRWFSKRWVWTALVGATVTVGFAAARGNGEGPPKVGAVISLNIDGKGERQFKVVKSEKQKDGTFLSELQDTKSGEIITLVDNPGDTPPTPPGMSTPPPGSPKDAPKTPEPKAKQRPNDPPPAATPDPAKDKEKDKRPILGRIFDRDKDKDKDKGLPAGMPSTASSSAKPDAPADSGKKPGLIGRVFGPKKPAGPSMPASSGTLPSGMPGTGKPSASPPPAVIPTPPGGFGGTAPPPFTPPKATPPAAPPVASPPAASPTLPKGSPLPPFPTTTPEPPRVMPGTKPVNPPTPAVPAPVTPVPMVPAPAVPAPATSAPVVPPVPSPPPAFTPPPPVAAPTPAPTPTPTPTPAAVGALGAFDPGAAGRWRTPADPGAAPSTSSAQPVQVIVPANYVPAGVAFDREVQPFVIALQSMAAPSARITAAKGLADGRHCSTDGVKHVLFQAAQMDPCGEVRAACITHLCDLGYFHPNFLGFIQTACDDTDSFVREAAKNACGKMIRQK